MVNRATMMVETLAACLCGEVCESDLPGVCFCGVLPGSSVALDYVNSCTDATCGMAWVRLVSATPGGLSSDLLTQTNNCETGLRLNVEVGIVRCSPSPDDEGNPPSAEDMLAATELQIDDMMLMRRAITCCVDSHDYLLGSYSPFGPEGGAVGGFWTVQILVI